MSFIVEINMAAASHRTAEDVRVTGPATPVRSSCETRRLSDWSGLRQEVPKQRP
jgi:hypothetical protein